MRPGRLPGLPSWRHPGGTGHTGDDPGPYRLPSYRFRARSVATNKAPEGATAVWACPCRPSSTSASWTSRRRAVARPRRDQAAQPGSRGRHAVCDVNGSATTPVTTPGSRGRPFSNRLPGFPSARALPATKVLLGLGFPATSSTRVSTHAHSTAADGRHRRPRRGSPEVDDEGEAQVWTTLPGSGREATRRLTAGGRSARLSPGSVRIERPDTSVGGLSGTGTFASRRGVSGGGALAGAVTFCASGCWTTQRSSSRSIRATYGSKTDESASLATRAGTSTSASW